jgi:hypothetical protein
MAAADICGVRMLHLRPQMGQQEQPEQKTAEAPEMEWISKNEEWI